MITQRKKMRLILCKVAYFFKTTIAKKDKSDSDTIKDMLLKVRQADGGFDFTRFKAMYAAK
jgi:hypothetical protein